MGDEETDVGDLFKKVVLLGCLDPSFEPEDLEELGDGDLARITEIANKIMGLSGMLGKDGADSFLANIPTSKDSSSSVSASSADSPQSLETGASSS